MNPYLRTKILTASPHELRLMLYDACLRMCRQAGPAIDARDFETSHTLLGKAKKIVLELSTSVTPGSDVTERLTALYTYIYRLLVEANTTREQAKLDEAIKLLEYQRETWAMLQAGPEAAAA